MGVPGGYTLLDLFNTIWRAWGGSGESILNRKQIANYFLVKRLNVNQWIERIARVQICVSIQPSISFQISPWRD